jgi:hypothetical protein
MFLSVVDVIVFLQKHNIIPGSKRCLTKLQFFGLVLQAKEQNTLLSKFIREVFIPLPPDLSYQFMMDTYEELSNCYYSFMAGHKKRTLSN